MQEIIYTKGYESLKEELRTELSKSVESFVRIGYLLKVARDTNILSESPYSNMEEFAYAEFKIDKGTASKFMNINDRFSEDGYSDRLKTEYSGIGWSKLSIMLQLPDSINEEITDGFSKSEIQEIKAEVEEAEKQTPIETMLEGETVVTAESEDILDKAILQLGESEPDIYIKAHAAVRAGNIAAGVKMLMAPAGENMYSIRIRGVGRILLSVKDYEEAVVLINERTGEKTTRTWQDVVKSWTNIIDTELEAKANWEQRYHQSFPQKDEVAPVQPKKESKVKKVNASKPKKVVSKSQDVESKAQEIVFKEQTQLHDIEPTVPEVQPLEQKKEEPNEEPVAAVDDNAQLPGQMSLEDVEKINAETYKLRKDAYVVGFEDNIGLAMANKESEQWELVKTDLEDALRFVELILELNKKEIE